MAEDRDDSQRTEEPTQKRLDDALKKGDVVKSMELASFAMLAGGTLALAMFAQSAARQFAGTFTVFLESPAQMTLDSGGTIALMKKCVFGLFAIIGPAAGLMMITALAGHLLQHRPFFAAAKIKPDLSKLSPLAGFKRLFGLDALVNLVKGVAKIVLVGMAAFLAVWPERSRLSSAMDMNPAGIASLALALIGKMLIAALVVFAVIAAVDYFYQRQRFLARHRMSRQELKDEMKQSEGDPVIKARIRQIRLERSKKRMIAAVPGANVVIVNPTHYAVALKYESGKMAAPVCVAKGMDHLALTIRRVAEENDVPIVENPPLARALYAAVDLDEPIPPEHYKAVAQIIGYVMRLANKNAFWRN
ncbi:MAG TPA: flagellar biosynthesis protein FlhB [Micropepsaceae bacterium]|nr:flagellar biosynthesis protein FlhB [Micropepsaceae bacterium]